MQLLNTLATIVGWTQVWTPASASFHFSLTAHHLNCSQITLEGSIISIEVNDSSMTSPEGSVRGCSVCLTPDPEFRQKAENYVFHVVNRRLACRLSVQIEDQLSNKTLPLCTWPEKILQTSVSVRIFSAEGPTLEPVEFQYKDHEVPISAVAKAGGPILTGAAFYRPRVCDDFKCRGSRICIPKEAVCDGRAHCPDGSDESTTKEDNVCFQFNSDSFSRIGIVLTSALLISVGLVFAAVIRRTLLERLKKPSKYEVNPGKEMQYTECETSFMSPELDTF